MKHWLRIIWSRLWARVRNGPARPRVRRRADHAPGAADRRRPPERSVARRRAARSPPEARPAGRAPRVAPRTARPARARRARAGPPLRRPHAAEEPGIHRHRHAVARARHRRQHRAVQPGRRPAAALAAGARARPPRAGPGRRCRRWDSRSRCRLRQAGVRLPSARTTRSSPRSSASSAWTGRSITIDGVAEPSREVEQVSENFFRDLGVTPIVGRMPEPSDGAVAVISHGWWRARFDGSASALGRVRERSTARRSDRRRRPAAVPRAVDRELRGRLDLVASRTRTQQMIARLKPGVTAAQAQAALHALFRQTGAGAAPGAADTGPEPLRDRAARRPARGSPQLRGAVRGRAAGAHGAGHARAADHLHERRQSADGAKRRAEA